jgi:hypothetical protein
MTNEQLTILICVVCIASLLMVGACLFFIGYFFGKYSAVGVSNTVFRSKSNTDQSLLKNHQIKIDDKKIVTEISTEGLEKKYDKLGETKKSDENITNSINKLKNIKR